MARFEGGREGEWHLMSHAGVTEGLPVESSAILEHTSIMDQNQKRDHGACTQMLFERSEISWAGTGRREGEPSTPVVTVDDWTSPTEHSSSVTANVRYVTMADGNYELCGQEKHQLDLNCLHRRKKEEFGPVRRIHAAAMSAPFSKLCNQPMEQAPLPFYPKRRTALMIQVEPGMSAPLRGSEETWQAIQDDFYVPAFCVICDKTLFVIQDAAFVLCPGCRTVSVVEGHFVDRIAAGVGMGFIYKDLIKWQREIMEGRKYQEEHL